MGVAQGNTVDNPRERNLMKMKELDLNANYAIGWMHMNWSMNQLGRSMIGEAYCNVTILTRDSCTFCKSSVRGPPRQLRPLHDPISSVQA